MIKERIINLSCLLGLFLFPIIAHFMDEPYFVTLLTKITIFAIGAIGLTQFWVLWISFIWSWKGISVLVVISLVYWQVML